MAHTSDRSSARVFAGRTFTAFTLLIVACLGWGEAAAGPQKLTSVTLQLKWMHQFQFAGFYAAVEKGFYREVGLDVTILEGGPGTDFIERVTSGRADFGVELPDLLLRRAAGDPVVVLAAIYQHSPYVLVSLASSNITSPHDLIGRRLMLRSSSNAEIRAMLLNEGVQQDQVVFVDHIFNAGDLARGTVDAMAMYRSTILHEPALEGLSLNTIEPLNYGVDFYGDCLFTSEQMIAKSPDQVRAFREASLRGWEYAMDHTEEIVELIHERYAPGKSVDALKEEAERMVPLLLSKFVEPGHMNPGRWRHIADTFARLGLLSPDMPLDGFLYDPHAAPDTAWLKWTAGFALVGVFLFGLAAIVLLSFNRHLDAAVQERTFELNRVNLALADEVRERESTERERLKLEQQVWHTQKLESLGVLAGGIAHDFNNLLTVILGSAEMAAQSLAPGTVARQYVEEIRGAGHRAADLTRQMLAYSGRAPFEVREIDLNALVDEMAQLLSVSISKNVRILPHLGTKLPGVNADGAQLQQVVMNLITNAAEAIGDRNAGEVCLATGLQYCTSADLEASRLPEKPLPGEYVFLEVADNGVGMEREALEKLFEPFFTTKPEGRGLGMSATLGIVRGHHGAITVKSESGSGTVIRVLLPSIGHPAGAAPTAAGVAEAGWRGSGRILVIDDEEAVRTLAGKMLERLGFEVCMAGDGEEGLEMFRAGAVELHAVLMDYSMPRMDGVQACAEIRKIDPSIPVIVCSGFDQSDIEGRFGRESVTAFVHKPFRFEDLRKAFQNALDGRTGS